MAQGSHVRKSKTRHHGKNTETKYILTFDCTQNIIYFDGDERTHDIVTQK